MIVTLFNILKYSTYRVSGKRILRLFVFLQELISVPIIKYSLYLLLLLSLLLFLFIGYSLLKYALVLQNNSEIRGTP